MHTIAEFIFVIARIMIASYFIIGTYYDITMRDELWQMMQAKKIPNYQIFYVCAVVLKISAALAIIFNVYTAIAAVLLFIFTGIANVIFNNFWRETGNKRVFTQIRFLVHIAIMGGLLLLTIMPLQ